MRSGRPPEALAWEGEPTASAIFNWVKQAGLDKVHRNEGLATFEQQNLRRVKRENKRLRMERDIPKGRFLVRPGGRLDRGKGFEFVKAH